MIKRLLSSPWTYILIMIIYISIIIAYSKTSWDDEVLLHDGRTIEVRREVAFHYVFAGLEELGRTSPDQHTLKFKHPDTGKSIKWSGERDINPIMLDFVDGVPYLVVRSFRVFSNVKLYGCPEIPYVFLKYNQKASQWIPIPRDQVPKVLRRANLSVRYAVINMKHDKQTKEYIAGQHRTDIPENNETWEEYNQYKYKRFKNDCRPPLPSEAEVMLPPPQEVKLEILETNNFTPVRVFSQAEWTSLVFDEKREEYCKSLFKEVDPYNPSMGKRFANDKTGKKKVPYHRSHAGMLCEPVNIFYFTHLELPNKMVITKYTVTGDMLYRISFENPESAPGFRGYINKPSLKADNGYLKFEWWYFQSNTPNWEVMRTLKVRVREPKYNQ